MESYQIRSTWGFPIIAVNKHNGYYIHCSYTQKARKKKMMLSIDSANHLWPTVVVNVTVVATHYKINALLILYRLAA